MNSAAWAAGAAEEAAADAVHSDNRNNLEAVVSYAVSG